MTKIINNTDQQYWLTEKLTAVFTSAHAVKFVADIAAGKTGLENILYPE